MTQDLGSQLQSLYQQFGQIAGVQFELHQNLIAVFVQSKWAEARIFLQGAQVSHFQPAGQQPVLWMSDANRYQPGQPLRGGIPISWPWFADLDKNPAELKQQLTQQDDYPAHGFARNQLWQLSSITRNGEVFELLLSYEPSEPVWPFKCRLELKVIVGRELSLQMSIHNLDSRDFRCALAFHSYFAVGDINRVSVKGLDGIQGLDCVQGWQSFEQSGDISIQAETDQVFEQALRAIELVDPTYERTIRIVEQELPSLVVWNPWQEKGAQLSQFESDDYHKMICVERASLLKNILLCHSGAVCHQNLVIAVS